jgi:peroxiredoxin
MMINILITLVLLTGSATAEKFYMLDFRLQSLHQQQTVDLSRFKGEMLFLTFVEAECSWCDKQIEAFNTLLEGEHAASIRVIAVAIGDDTEALRAKTSKAGFPVFKASEVLLESIGGVTLTPYTLIADRNGNFETKIVGYKDADQIEAIIHQMEGNE